MLEEVDDTTRACDAGGPVNGNLQGAGNDQGATLTGNFVSSGYNCVTGTHTETWGEVNVTHDDDRGTLGMVSFGMSRETQANGVLRGRFVEGYLSKSEVETEDVTGTITGFGIHGGLFGARGTEGGLILSYYGSAAVGQHSFDLDAGSDIDGNYTYAGVFAGAAIGGERDFGALSIKPRIGVDLAYAKSIGSQISLPNVELEIDPATYVRGFVELGLSQETDNGMLNFTPRLFCETNEDEDADVCGFGATFDYGSLLAADGAQWSVGFDYEAIDDRQSASLKVAHSREIFDGVGVSKSSFGATATGSLQVEQTVVITW